MGTDINYQRPSSTIPMCRPKASAILKSHGKMMRPALLAALVVILSGQVGHAQTRHLPKGVERLSIDLEQGGNLLFVPVVINGKDAGHFIIDTGASHSVIHEAVAKELVLTRQGTVTVKGTGGSTRAVMRRVRSFKLGEFEVGPHALVGADLSVWSETLGVEIAGLMGYDALSQLPFTIDYRKAKLTFFDHQTFDPSHLSPTAHLTKLSLIDKRPWVETWIDEKHQGLLMLDTGVQSALQLTPSFVATHKDIKPKQIVGKVEAVGVAGSEHLDRGHVQSLFLLGHRWRQASCYFPKPGRRSISRLPKVGLVGGRILKHYRLTFDYRGGRIWATWLGDQDQDEDRTDIDTGDKPGNDRDFLGRTALCDAALEGDLRRVQTLINSGEKLNATDRKGMSPMFYAVRSGNLGIVRLLVKAGADIDLASKTGETPLMLAAQNGQINTAKFLVQSGANVGARSKSKLTPLLLAASNRQTEMLVYLLSQGAKPNDRNATGATAILMVSHQGDLEALQALIKAGADVDAVDDSGHSALMLAAQADHDPIARRLLQAGANVHLKSKAGFTAKEMTKKQRTSKVLQLLIQAGAR